MANRNKAKDIDPQKVRSLAEENKGQMEIATALGCSVATLHRNFKKQMSQGYQEWERKTRQSLEGLAAIHCTLEEMAAVTDISVDTLERRFSDIIKKGKEIGKSSLRRTQWEAAQNIKDSSGRIVERGNHTMQIWLGKQLLDQKDLSKIQVEYILRSLPIETINAELNRRQVYLLPGGKDPGADAAVTPIDLEERVALYKNSEETKP
jgi:AraC-like DNA-binding protein